MDCFAIDQRAELYGSDETDAAYWLVTTCRDWVNGATSRRVQDERTTERDSGLINSCKNHVRPSSIKKPCLIHVVETTVGHTGGGEKQTPSQSLCGRTPSGHGIQGLLLLLIVCANRTVRIIFDAGTRCPVFCL